MSINRRTFLRVSGAGFMVAQAPAILAGETSQAGDSNRSELPFELGVASYTFREFTLDQTIEMTNRLAIKHLCLKSMHMPLDATPEEIRASAAKVRNAGIDLYGAGVIYMTSPEEVDNAWAYAQAAGLKVIVGVPDHALLDQCNQKVKDTGILLAIHNHGPGDDNYPSPESVYERVKDLDPGVGLCVDIGHTVRIGLDPIREVSRFMDRVLDIHIKDEDKADEDGNTCEIGRGVIDIPGFLKMLLKEKYSHVVSFEFEKDGNDPLPGLAESVGYVRGVLDLIG
ncbi:MAG: sugar phosphate isomerase/epimerase family protein [Bacteroidales bacterium]